MMFQTTSIHVPGPWRASTYSGGNGSSQCVEAAVVDGLAAVRDSKVKAGQAHLFEPAAWADFLNAFK